MTPPHKTHESVLAFFQQMWFIWCVTFGIFTFFIHWWKKRLGQKWWLILSWMGSSCSRMKETLLMQQLMANSWETQLHLLLQQWQLSYQKQARGDLDQQRWMRHPQNKCSINLRQRKLCAWNKTHMQSLNCRVQQKCICKCLQSQHVLDDMMTHSHEISHDGDWHKKHAKLFGCHFASLHCSNRPCCHPPSCQFASLANDEMLLQGLPSRSDIKQQCHFTLPLSWCFGNKWLLDTLQKTSLLDGDAEAWWHDACWSTCCLSFLCLDQAVPDILKMLMQIQKQSMKASEQKHLTIHHQWQWWIWWDLSLLVLFPCSPQSSSVCQLLLLRWEREWKKCIHNQAVTPQENVSQTRCENDSIVFVCLFCFSKHPRHAP